MGAGDPRCKIMIVIVKTSPNAETYRQKSQILVLMDSPGVEIAGPMTVFGHDEAPHGHMHIRFTNVRVPEANMLLGEGPGASKSASCALDRDASTIACA